MSVGPILGLVVAAALVVWVVRAVMTPRRTPDAADVDREELEAAEREVRDLATGVRPEDDVPGSEWGPGTARPPTRL